MATGFPILFTGSEVNFEVPKFEEMNRAADNLQKKLQMNAVEDKELMKEFRENMNLDLGALVSNHATQQQADMSKAFENKWTLELKKNGNKVTNDMLLGMRKDINAMTSRQGQWQQSQKLWEQDRAKVEQAGGEVLYDKEKFAKDTEEFMRTGVYKPGALEYSGVNMATVFDNTKWQGSSKQVLTKTEIVNGKEVTTTTTANVTDPKEAQAYIAQTILSNPRYLKGAQKAFMALDDKVKIKYLEDYNADGKVTLDDMGNMDMSSLNIMDNPIMKWATSEDGYLPMVRRKDKSVTERPAKVTGGGSDDEYQFDIDVKVDGKPAKARLKGAAARAYAAAHPEAVGMNKDGTPVVSTTPEVPAVVDPVLGNYTPPLIEDNKFSYDELKPTVLNFKEKVKGIFSDALTGVDSEGKVVKLKDVDTSEGVTIISISPNNEVTFKDSSEKIITTSIDNIKNKDRVLTLKVNTPSGVKTIKEVMNNPDLITTAPEVNSGETKKPQPY